MLKITVGIDGDYHTIKEALEAVPYNESAHILIKAGLYKEKLFFEKRDITIEGEGMEETVISYNDGAKDILPDGTRRGTFRSYTLFAGGKNVRIKNLTVENTAGTGKEAGQALAFYADADRIYMENVCFKSHQDTLFMSPLPKSVRQPGGFFGPRHLNERRLTRQFYKNCKITGDIDFIFGGADAVFEDCEIIALNKEVYETSIKQSESASEIKADNLCKPKINGYIAAPCESDGKIGIVFKNCTIHGESGIEKETVFLARPWRPEGKVVYINCKFDESINPLRFSEWGQVKTESTGAFFAEYNSMDLNGNPIDLSDRNSWVKILSDDEETEIEKLIKEE